MKILFITQKVDINDDLLGFVHGWIQKMAANVEKITVLALGVGEYHLPNNVAVFSLGKNQEIIDGMDHWSKRLKYTATFYNYVWRLRADYDIVFVHMNVEYILLAGLFWRLWGKKIALWYVHVTAPFKLKIAAILAKRIFTATEQSCKIKSKKIRVLQHGIDTNLFQPENTDDLSKLDKLLSLGRVSPVKNLETLVEAFGNLINQGKKIDLDIVGEPGPVNRRYYEKIRKLVADLRLDDQVKFRGKIPNRLAPKVFNEHGIFINLTAAGSFDKSVLEAMSCGLVIFVSNRVFEDVLPVDLQKLLMFEEKNSRDLAKKIIALDELSKIEIIQIKKKLRQIIIDNHNLDNLISKLINGFFEL
jgi:glycosyltransferase involved in cell wall biosynthesis